MRETPRRLEGELLVKRSGTQRTFVADWSLGDVRDAFELRGMLEGHAARPAADRMNEPLLHRLRAANRAIGTTVQASRPDVDGFIEGNREFHTIILEAAASPRFAALLGTLVEQPVVWRTAHQYGREALRRSHGEHDELIAAFARRDGAWAEAVMTGPHPPRLSRLCRRPRYFQAHEAVVEVETERFGSLRMQNAFPRLSATPSGVRSPAPSMVGQHNAEVLGGLLGLDRAELERLAAVGII